MKSTLARLGLMVVLAASLAGCGSSGDEPATGTNPTGTAESPLKNNPRAAFSIIVDAGLTPVTVNGSPEVKFAVIGSSGKPVPGLKLIGGDAACGGNNVKMAIAKFDGANWQSLISRQRYAVDSAGQFAVVEASTDPVPTATIFNPATALADPATRVVGILQEDATTGYYTYYFATDVTTALKLADAVDGKNVSPGKLANNEKLAVKNNATVHRVALQLCFVDPQTAATVRVSPNLDFTLDSSGIAHPIKDAQGKLTDAREVVDKDSCNECHQTLAARHDAALVDPNACVVCHNPGSADYATGNPIDLKLMVHRLHMGKRLKQDYQLRTLVARKDTGGVITGIDYPQDQKNCAKCHDSAKAKDAANSQLKPSKNACWGCHSDYKYTTSRWYSIHVWTALGIDRDNPDAASDSVCSGCHVGAIHTIPEWTNSANYQYNIHSVTWNPDRTVSVEFSVNNPAGGFTYNIKDSSYQYTTVDIAGTTTTKNFVFGNLAVLFGWGSSDYTNAGAIAADAWSNSCTTAVPVGSPTCNVTTGLPASAVGGTPVTRGQPVLVNAAFGAVPVPGSYNRFKVTSTQVPAAVSGTGTVVLQGSISLQKNANSSYIVPVKNVVSNFAIGGSGTAVPRRTVVSADKCNACHGRNINMNNHVPSHSGNSTELETCVICHNANSVLTAPPAGVDPSLHFKRLIHIKHKAMGQNFPVMPSTERTVATPKGLYIGYTGIKNCNLCHVDNTYNMNLDVMGSSTAITDTDPSNNLVISPKAAVCSSCHDTVIEKSHIANVGGAAFGTVKQGELGAKVYEACDGCHAPGSLAPVADKHGLK
ncbi:MAG: OmcA/MtrC family decaheme c-type cytochrome [Gallionella sp.]|nr:OmcA/MtrC family decaheme c-type cytochrome [Gallionella sp.]